MNSKKKIYIFGNPLLPFDNMPNKLAPELERAFPKIDFIIADPNENLKPENGKLVIIDTVIGPKKVVVMDEVKKIELSPAYSMHDLDLGFNLKLLKKIGKLKKITIFGIPNNLSKKKALVQLTALLRDKVDSTAKFRS